MFFSPAALLRILLPVILVQSAVWSNQRAGHAREFAAPAGPSVRKPNFVIILVDDMGWADIGLNGSRFYQTPHIDQLAARGMQFKQAYAAAPVCSPTRAALLTGQYPARLQITDWLPGRPDQPSQKLKRAFLKKELPLEETTLAEVLKSNGYRTAHIGKWHLGEEDHGPLQQGFDVNIGGDESGSPASYFYPYANEANPAWRIPGLTGGRPNEYLTDRLTTEAEGFMEQNRHQPFLLYLAHYAVHIPMKAKEELIKKYAGLAKPGAAQHNAIYAAMIQSVDESVGRMIKKLQQLQLDNNTVLIFTSDNGGLSVEEGPHTPATSNAPLRAGKGYLYEGGLRVPLLMCIPGRKGGLISNEPVSSVDMYPTILGLAGIRQGTEKKVDGKSLLPLWNGHTLQPRNLYWHYPHYSNQGGKPGWAIRQGDYKLIRFFEEGKIELYNVQTDPGEQKNLAEKLPQKAVALQRALVVWGKKTGAQFMRPNPEYKGR